MLQHGERVVHGQRMMQAASDIYLGWTTQGVQAAHQGWLHIARMIDWVCDNWDQPDEGIWETRGGRKDFTYGRFQTWVALDRATRMAARRGRPANVQRWTTERDRVYNQIMERGWNPTTRAFTQDYSSEVLDSSLLMMPLQGFVAPRDPMWISTLEAMDRELVSDSLVYRYNPAASPDGLAGDEGTFSLCTFWYVEALARAGRLDEARLTFEKMHTYANHLGLYSEEIGSTGEQLGNFPQAFSHLALISAAINLDYQLDHGAGAALWTIDLVVMLTGLGFAIAVVNAAIRVLFAMGRERALPASLARLSSRQTPAVSIGCVAVLALVLGLPLTYADGGSRTFGYLAGAGGLSIALIYLAVNIAAIRASRTEFRDQFRLWRHLLVPATAAVLFLFPLWGIVHPRSRTLADLLPFAALGWLGLGAIAAGVLRARRPASFETLGRVFMPATDSQAASRSTSRPRDGV